MREKKLFLDAIEISDPLEREIYLNRVCRGKPDLRKRIDALIAAANGIGQFLEPDSNYPDVSADRKAAEKKPDRQTVERGRNESAISLDFLAPATDPRFLGCLGHYDIISVLGQGAFGIVLNAFDRRLHRQVAIKVLSPQLAMNSPPRKRFLREARSCAAIQHPNVVHVYDVSDSPTPFIAMEYIDGQTLQERINAAGPLEIAEVIEVAKQLASGLEAAHAAGLIHRDIKPSNILIENRSQLRAILTDFGLARAVDDASLTQSGVLTGTPIFMSPEQAQGKLLDYRTDLFSLGSVLYVMITGRLPFRARSTVAVLQRVANDTARPIADLTPDCPAWLAELVGQLHEKIPEKRIQTASEVRKLLERGGKRRVHNLASPRPVSTPMPQVAPVQPKRIIGAILALLMVAVVVVAAIVFREPQSADEAKQSQVFDEVRQASADVTMSQNVASPPLAAHWHHLPSHAPRPAITPFPQEDAVRFQQEWADFLKVPVEFTDRHGITFRLIPPGEFVMGTSEKGIQIRLYHVESQDFWKQSLLSEGPQHRVAITEPYYLSTTEVTQNQFESIMSYNPSYFPSERLSQELGEAVLTFNSPVEGVTWDETQNFIHRLHQRLDAKSKEEEQQFYRLPSEAEWEFACRGGTQSNYWTGEEIDSLVSNENHNGLIGRIMPVGSFQLNPFGLYDMSGNVHEYVQDRWDSRYHIPPGASISVNPLGPHDPNLTWRVARGGDYWWWAYHSRSAYRIGVEQSVRSPYTIGFRLAGHIDAYRTALPLKTSESVVTDFSEIHGASRDDLQAWLKSIRGRYVPLRINLRWGSVEHLFDAVAVNDADEGPWQVHFFKNDQEAGRDFSQMRGTHDIFWKLLFPQPDTLPHHCAGLKIWRNTDASSATWNIGDNDLLQAVNDSKVKGWLPMSLAYTESGNGKNSAFVQHIRPGVGNQSFVGLTVSDFRKKVTEFRDRNWRLHFFQLQAGTSEPRLSCVFRENLDGVSWETSIGLTQQQFELQLDERRLSKWYPSCVGSYFDDGVTYYLVCWEKMSGGTIAAPIPKPARGSLGGQSATRDGGERRNSGGFGGR